MESYPFREKNHLTFYQIFESKKVFLIIIQKYETVEVLESPIKIFANFQVRFYMVKKVLT